MKFALQVVILAAALAFVAVCVFHLFEHAIAVGCMPPGMEPKVVPMPEHMEDHNH